MIHVTDWFPTILSLAGATEDAHEEVLDSIDGVDQVRKGVLERVSTVLVVFIALSASTYRC